MKLSRKIKLILAPLLVVAFFAGFFAAELILTRGSAPGGGDDASAAVTFYEADGASAGSAPPEAGTPASLATADTAAPPDSTGAEYITENGTSAESAQTRQTCGNTGNSVDWG
jgi:hypothetical protein